MNRLSGLLLIIRGLTPVLIVLTLYWGYTRIAADFALSLKPLDAIENEMAALGETIDTARAQFDTARADAEAAIGFIQGFRIPDLLPNLPANLSFPALDIPTLNAPIVPTVSVTWTNATGSVSRTVAGACHSVLDFFGIPSNVCDDAKTVIDSVSFSYPSGINFGTTNFTIDFPTIPGFSVPLPPFFNTIAGQLKGIFSAFDGVFDRFDRTFTHINALGDKIRVIPDRLTAIGQSGQQIMSGLAEVMTQRAGLVVAALIIVLALAAYIVVGNALRYLGRGLHLLVLGR